MDNQNFINQLKKVKLDFFLSYISEIIREMFLKQEAIRTQQIKRHIGSLQQTGSIFITTWGLSNISYQAILNTNDFNSFIPNEMEFWWIYNDYLGWDNEKSGKEFIDEEGYAGLARILFGLSNEQFWYQDLSQLHTDFSRNVELLQIIPKKIESSVDIDFACNEMLGMNTVDLRYAIAGLFALGFTNSDITNYRYSFDEKVVKEGLKRDSINRVLK